MLNIFEVTVPFFALVFCGYVAARRRLLPLEAIAGLNGFVLYFAVPCMLYRFGANTPVAQLLDPGVFIIWLMSALVMVAVSIVSSLNVRIGWNDASFGALVAAFPNSGFMGVPLLVAIMGVASAGPVILTITIDLLITTTLCIGLSRLDGADEHGVAKALKKTLKGAASNPMPWAILAGAVVSWGDLSLPGPVHATVGLLADAASPVALFTIGAVLARSQLLAISGHAPKPVLADYLPMALFKLLLHPFLVLLLGSVVMKLGVPVSSFALTVLVLTAALPSASNVSLLAERYGADNGRIARIILVSTAASFVSFSLLVGLMI